MKRMSWLLPAVLLLATGFASAQDATNGLRTDFRLALQARAFDDALRHARALLERQASEPALLDELSYALTAAGAARQATNLLLHAYPFAGAGAAERNTLVQRLMLVFEQYRSAVGDAPLQALRAPLDTPALRSRQASFWATQRDCGAVRTILGDLASEYEYDDLMRLGDCAIVDAPAVAQQAYARAHMLRPGGRASRALAYQAHTAGDYPAALVAWRGAEAGRLEGGDLLGAVTTALAAEDDEQAADWLQRYRDRGGPLHHRYWSLLAQAYMRSDAAMAQSALERAVALHPDIDDYLRLSRLEREAERQLLWLERAAALERDNATLQLELAYAYARAGRRVSALDALKRAAALDPGNAQVQGELGYAYWNVGHTVQAQLAFERAWQADSDNLVLAQQLVYVHQRLKQNELARSYARQVLDATASLSGADRRDAAAAADRRFQFQRLHEDLGRRVTVNLDGWSGTGVGTGSGASQAGARYRSYSQFEADVRLGNPPVRDGSTLSAYARVLTDGGDDSALPSRNAMLGVGVRWKPLRRHVLYLAAENQNGLEDHLRRDVLFRASASLLNGGRHSDDWRPSGKGWVARNLYLDVGHYVRARHDAFMADYRTSYHRKVSEKQTIEPYGHVQFSRLRAAGTERDVRAGIGLRWNMWHGATSYNADPHKLAIGVEFQHAFETSSTARRGVFLTLSTRW
jgi:bacteriophage N4 adsorption protein A